MVGRTHYLTAWQVQDHPVSYMAGGVRVLVQLHVCFSHGVWKVGAVWRSHWGPSSFNQLIMYCDFCSIVDLASQSSGLVSFWRWFCFLSPTAFTQLKSVVCIILHAAFSLQFLLPRRQDLEASLLCSVCVCGGKKALDTIILTHHPVVISEYSIFCQ